MNDGQHTARSEEKGRNTANGRPSVGRLLLRALWLELRALVPR